MQIREISHKVSNNNPEYSDATEILWPHPIYPRIIYHLRFLKYALDFIIFGCWNNSLKSNIYIRSQTHQTFVTEFGKPPPPLQCHWMSWCWPILAFYQPVCGIPLYCHLVCKLMTFHVHPRLWKLELSVYILNNFHMEQFFQETPQSPPKPLSYDWIKIQCFLTCFMVCVCVCRNI